MLTVVLLAALIAAFVVPGMSRAASAELPEDMLGVWITSDPKYADRSFEIGRTELTLQVGKDSFVNHVIDRVELDERGGAELYTVHYLDDSGVEYELAFYYQTDEIRLKNQRTMMWRKKP